jgi:hypothetical protein
MDLFGDDYGSPEFNGDDYQPERDKPRLQAQMKRIFDLMSDGQWRTLQEIADTTKDPPSSVSAQLRHLRKKRFGGYLVERDHMGNGLYKYRVLSNEATRME